jgi:hypothetical protein
LVPFVHQIAQEGGNSMTRVWEQLKAASPGVLRQAKIRKWLVSGLVVLFIFQLYFVREMLAAEVLFGMGFAVLLVLCSIFYVVGAIGERGLDLAEAGIRVAARSARWGYSTLEEISKRQYRHPHSESAP